MPKKNIVCITKKKKNNDNYVICFDSKKSKKSKKTNKKSNKKTNKKITKDKYIELLEKHKKNKLSKKDKKLLDNELFKKYCTCIRTLKRSKNKKMYDAKYGICMNSVYKNRNITPPFNASKKCKFK